MKFWEYFFSPTVRPFSVIVGAVVGFILYLLFGWEMGLFGGAVATLLAALGIPLFEFARDIPYKRIKKTLPKPLHLDQRVNFTVKNGIVRGYMILTDSTLVFLSFDHGKHRLELKRADVKSVKLESNTICVFLNEKQFVRILSLSTEEIYEVLQQKGWVNHEKQGY